MTKIPCGDFNCVENPTLDRYPAKTSSNTESKHLTELVQICKIFDCATQLQQTKHTFFSEISSSRIDRIYASNDVNVVSVRVSPNHFSDHNALIVRVDIPLQASRGKLRILEKQRNMLRKLSIFNRFRNKMENLEKTTKQFEPCRVVDSSQKQS